MTQLARATEFRVVGMAGLSSVSERVLVAMAKAPRAGAVKTAWLPAFLTFLLRP